jgi:hypothetical protein
VNLSQPVTSEYIIGAIVLIFIFVAIGLAIVQYYKKRK